MSESIKIKNPSEVAAKTREITALLMQYEEIYNDDINVFSSVEGSLSSTRDRIKVKISELEMALQRTKAMAESSEKARALVKQYEAKIAAHNRNLQEIHSLQHEISSFKNEVLHMKNEITSISSEHNNLQSRINTMLNRISEMV